MEKLKIAIVGCGGIANQKHMPSIRANAEKAEMVAFCDIIPERAQKAAEVLHMHSRWMSELVLRYMPHFLLIPDGQTDIWK